MKTPVTRTDDRKLNQYGQTTASKIDLSQKGSTPASKEEATSSSTKGASSQKSKTTAKSAASSTKSNWNSITYDASNTQNNMNLQGILKNYDSSIQVDGNWKDSDTAALKKYGQTALHYMGNGTYGYVAGNGVPWYSSEADRAAKNEEQVRKSGITYKTVTDEKGRTYQTWDTNQDLGELEADSTGGMFDRWGYSNNPYYLQTVIGLSREQVNQNPVLAGLSDKVLETAYNQNQPYANSLYYHDGGMVSNAKSDISIGEIREALAELTGQKATGDGWWGGTSFGFVSPDYYNPYTDTGDTPNYGTRQYEEIIAPMIAQYEAAAAANSSSPSSKTSSTTTTTGKESATAKTQEEIDEELRRYIASLLKLGGR